MTDKLAPPDPHALAHVHGQLDALIGRSADAVDGYDFCPSEMAEYLSTHIQQRQAMRAQERRMDAEALEMACLWPDGEVGLG